MTIFLTDQPAAVGGFVPEGTVWHRVERDARIKGLLNPVIQRLCPARPVWSARVAKAGSPLDDRVVLLVDDAPASQFQAILDGLKAGEVVPDHFVAIALTGSGFRGQRQRGWTALRGNLHLTAHYRVSVEAASHQAALTMIPAVAAAEAIVEVSGGRVKPRIKWVNDVLAGPGKVSGVLTATGLSGAKLEYVTFGIGLNIDRAPMIESTPFVPEAACLADVDPALRGSLPGVFAAVVRHLDEAVGLLVNGVGVSLFSRYRAMAGFIGAKVAIWPEGIEDWRAVLPVYEGCVLDLNPDLSLVVEGRERPIATGRMALKNTKKTPPPSV